MNLYKFLDIYGLEKTLQNKSFKVSPIVELNDYFEFRAGLNMAGTPYGGQEDLFWDSVIAPIAERVGVICFSDSPENPAMWGHYSSSNKGALIEIRSERSKFLKISYFRKRPVINFNEYIHSAKRSNHLTPEMKIAIRQKSIFWKFEREYRRLISLDACEMIDGVWNHRIDSFATISKIIVGIRCQLPDTHFENLLVNAGYSDVKVVRAKAHPTEYTIDF